MKTDQDKETRNNILPEKIYIHCAHCGALTPCDELECEHCGCDPNEEPEKPEPK